MPPLVILEKKGLTDSEYTVTEEEKLLKLTQYERPYVWRVRAIDGASNEGEWSDYHSFYIAPAQAKLLPPPSQSGRPGWLRYLGIGLAAAGVGFLVCWWRQRRPLLSD